MKATYKGESYTVMDKTTYKGHVIHTLHKLGGYTFYIVDKKYEFETMKDAKAFAKEA